MAVLAVDPILVTVPAESDASAVRARLSALASWLAEVRDSPFEWRHFVECSDKLQSSGNFLTFTAIRALVNRHRLPFNAGQLNQAISRFFQDRGRSLRASLKVRDALAAEPPGIEVNPTELVTRNAVVEAEFSVALACVAVHIAMSPHPDHFGLVTEVLAQHRAECNVSVTVLMTDPPEALLGKRTCTAALALILAPQDMVAWMGARTIFAHGEAAILNAIMKLAGAGAPGRVVLGKDFLASVGSRGVLADGTCLEKILRVCAVFAVGGQQELGRAGHHVRESQSRSSKQLKRSDGASAWRVPLAKHGAGWRLHLWHYADAEGHEVFELVTVQAEQDPVVM